MAWEWTQVLREEYQHGKQTKEMAGSNRDRQGRSE